MRKMAGMETAVRAKTTQIDGISFVREDGRPYGTIRATGNPDQQSLVSEYEIFRGDLSQILFDMTKDDDNIKFVFGEQVSSIQQQQGGKDNESVIVEFANGYPTSEYDLVVACDGATSRTRALGLDCGVRDHMVPTNCWAAYFSINQDLLEGSKIGQSYSAPGGRFFAIGPDPSGVNRVTLMGINPPDAHEAGLLFRKAVTPGDDALKQFISQLYESAGWRTNELIKGMFESKDFYATEIVQVQIPTLSKGRFVLIGDAGYAPGFTGGGTSLAIAGAYVLAGEVSRCKGNLAEGLKAYETRMRPIINELQKVPPLVPAILAPQTAWGLWLRNNIFAFIAWARILEFGQRFFAGAFASTDKHKLPSYDSMA
jgi:2-polyprenyl-6-methoxyphenol hydroxylase-like FAD-dependent oxidoreductase